MTDGELAETLNASFSALEEVADQDWAQPAGSLKWTCWQTIDHTIDCVHSFALQIGAEADSGFLPFAQMHAEATASPVDLLKGLRGVSALLVAVARESPQDRTASDGIVTLTLSDWRSRTAYEVALHTYDVVIGLGGSFSLSDELAASIIESEALWMFDRTRVLGAPCSWLDLVQGSGR
ncbi:MAG: DinB family protein [Acidimicrobiales bacterium]